ncbi:MAG: PDZ domain-containing protein, partial [Planctomycetia bacterium]|nr:PDZ domain-containing protein [Planctomycetia bacterium]
EPAGLAYRAGLREHDVIVSVGGKSIGSLNDFQAATGDKELSRGVRLQVVREGMRRFVVIRSEK